jgi:hypothetical protein
MDLRRLSLVGLVAGATVLAGCVTPASHPDPTLAKSVTPPPAPITAAAGPTPDDPTGLKSRLRGFLANDALSTTPAKPGQGARLTAAWNNKVIYAPDPTHGGDPVPGLMGKLWVFGPDESVQVPLALDGEIFVGAWDNSPKLTGGQPVLIEVWHIDPEAVKKVRRNDFIGGQAYNLFLPWSQYHVDLKSVNVVARFNAADGRSLVSAPETLAMDHSATLQRAAERLALTDPAAIAPPAPAVSTSTVTQQPTITGPLNGK